MHQSLEAFGYEDLNSWSLISGEVWNLRTDKNFQIVLFTLFLKKYILLDAFIFKSHFFLPLLLWSLVFFYFSQNYQTLNTDVEITQDNANS